MYISPQYFSENFSPIKVSHNLDSNRWIGRLQDFVENYNSSYHSAIKNIPERLELFDEVELIRKSIEHNLRINNSDIEKETLSDY